MLNHLARVRNLVGRLAYWQLLLISLLVAFFLRLQTPVYGQMDPPVPPVLLSPSDGITTDVAVYPPLGIPLFEWNAVENAISYDIQIDDDINFVNPLINGNTSLTFYAYPRVDKFLDGEYFWHVRSRGDGGVGEWSDTWFFTKDWASVSAPTLLAPAYGATIEFFEAPTFSWQPVVGAAYYRLQISSDPDFGTTWLNQATIFPTFTPQNRPSNGTYYWRVSAYDTQNHAGDSSEVRRLELGYDQVPTLLGPEDTAQPKFTPTFRWTAVKGAWEYKLQYGTSENFQPGTYMEVRTRNVTYTPGGSIPNDVDYFWRVCARYGGGVDGPWSEVRSFQKYWHTGNQRLRLLTPLEGQMANYPFLFSWTPVREAAYYKFEVCPDMSGSGTGCEEVDVRGATLLSPQWRIEIPDDYFWRVTPYDNSGNPGDESEWGSFRARLEEPGLGSTQQAELVSPRYYYSPPSDYPETDTRQIDLHHDPTSPIPTFVWTRVFSVTHDEVHHYKLQVSTSTLFIDTAWEYETRNPSATPDDDYPFTPTTGVDYYWRVLAYDENDQQIGIRSEWWRTRIDPSLQVTPTDTISLTYPLHGQEIMEVTPSMRWLPVQGAAGYLVEVHREPDCSDSAIYSMTTRYVQHTPPVRLLPGTYFWRVRALDTTGAPTGLWSPTRRFLIEFQSRWARKRWSAPYDPDPSTELMTAIADTMIATDTVEGSNGVYDIWDLYANSDELNWYLGFHVGATTPGTPVWYGMYIDTNQDDERGADVGPPIVFGLPGSPNILTPSHHRPEFALYVTRDATGVNTDTVWLHTWDLDEEQWNYGTGGDPRNLLDVIDIGGGMYYSSTTQYVELRIPKEHLDSPGSLSIALFTVAKGTLAAMTIEDSVPDSGEDVALVDHFASLSERPTLLYPDLLPLDGEMSFSYHPVLVWQTPDVDYYGGYKVEIALEEDFLGIEYFQEMKCIQCAPFVDTGFTGITMLNPLDDSTTYFWRVMVRHDDGLSPIIFGEPSEPMSFVKVGAAPRDLNVSVDYTIPTFSWSSVEGAARYRIEATQNPDFDPITFWETNHHQYTPDSGLALGTWYWRVRVLNKDYTGDPSEVMSFTLTLPTPTPIWPEDEATIEYGPTFEWQTVLTPTAEPIFHPREYHLQVCRDENCTNVVFSRSTQTTSYTWDNSLEDRTGYYYWRVAVIDGYGRLGPYSPVRAFHKQGPTVEIISPGFGDSILETPVFYWEPVTGTADYEIQISTDRYFDHLYESHYDVDNAFFVPGREYDPLDSYWWRVRACDDKGHCGSWTDGLLVPTELTISKTGPPMAEPQSPITYTLTVRNYTITATNVLITDSIPTGAVYVSGGTNVENMVHWAIDSLGAYASTQVSFVVQASTTITNDDYRVTAKSHGDDLSAVGDVAVVTTIIVPLSSVEITGPSTGIVSVTYPFTATVSPPDAALPITYHWQATDQTDVEVSWNARAHTIPFTWTAPGTKVITVTATNAGDTVTHTHTIVVSAPPSGVEITGPTLGIVNAAYTFIATVSPPDATLPITYHWQATDQTDVMVSRNVHADAVPFTWTANGTKAITVTATNAEGTATHTHTITISRGCYLPLVLRH